MSLLHVLNDQFSQISKISSMVTNFMMTQSSSFEWKPSFPSSCVRNLILVVNILISALEIDVKWSEVWKGVSGSCCVWLVRAEPAERDAQWMVAPELVLAVVRGCPCPWRGVSFPSMGIKTGWEGCRNNHALHLLQILGYLFTGWMEEIGFMTAFHLSDETSVSAQRFNSSVQTAAPFPFSSSILVLPKAKAFFNSWNHHRSFIAAHQGCQSCRSTWPMLSGMHRMELLGCVGRMIPVCPFQLGIFDGSASLHHATRSIYVSMYWKAPKFSSSAVRVSLWLLFHAFLGSSWSLVPGRALLGPCPLAAALCRHQGESAVAVSCIPV